MAESLAVAFERLRARGEQQAEHQVVTAPAASQAQHVADHTHSPGKPPAIRTTQTATRVAIGRRGET
jgi:hypothetical protein